MDSIDGKRACAFCNCTIEDDASICGGCTITYNIKNYDNHIDGCGCDK